MLRSVARVARGRGGRVALLYGRNEGAVNVDDDAMGVDGAMRRVIFCILVSVGFPATSFAVVPETWPHASLLAEPGWSATLAVGLERGVIPVFRAGSRDRLRASVEAVWAPVDPVALDLRYDGIQDRHPDGTVVTGSGDLELGTTVRLWRGTWGPGRSPEAWAVGLAWRAKLPNAQDDGEIGTDETDVAMTLLAEAQAGRFRPFLGGGLAILGNPLRYTDQDDVPFLQVGMRWSDGEDRAVLPDLRAGVDWGFSTTRNPARGEGAVALEWGRRWRLGVEGGGGLTPAAADARVRLFLGMAGSTGS